MWIAHFAEGSRSLEELDMTIPYYHVDAFTDELFAGNPAGVCILSTSLADSVMQKIAAENRHRKPLSLFLVRMVISICVGSHPY